MTHNEIEKLALRLRKTGLNSSWNELMIMGEELAGNIGDAYGIVSSLVGEQADKSSGDVFVSSATLQLLEEKLGKAMEVLGGEGGLAG
ncbi:MAG: hypothetical protein PHY25_00310 [Dehalococcoidales bacterium]|jgi:NaMN:DMB phosphoribosyltransferase|nr:hypothetical protein [Dehalococcoidales bacterium]MDD4465117.1 hypothetical protein [Dehalococcoidales bacterium]